MRATNLEANGVVSINTAGITLNFPRIEGQALTNNPVTYTLPHSRLHEAGDYLNRIRGGQFNSGPEIPRIEQQRNSLGLLSSYLNLLHTQLENVNPMLRRASDLLERENLVQGGTRQEFGEFAHNIGHALHNLSDGIEPVALLLRDLRFLPNSGSFGVIENQQNPNQNQQSSPVQRPANQQPGSSPQRQQPMPNQAGPHGGIQVHHQQTMN